MGAKVVAHESQPTLRLWCQDDLTLFDIIPGMSMDQLLKLEQPYRIRLEGAFKRLSDLRGGLGLYWPEGHVVTLHSGKTTIGFTGDQLASVYEEPDAIAHRLKMMLGAHLEIDNSFVESLQLPHKRVV